MACKDSSAHNALSWSSTMLDEGSTAVPISQMQDRLGGGVGGCCYIPIYEDYM